MKSHLRIEKLRTTANVVKLGRHRHPSRPTANRGARSPHPKKVTSWRRTHPEVLCHGKIFGEPARPPQQHTHNRPAFHKCWKISIKPKKIRGSSYNQAGPRGFRLLPSRMPSSTPCTDKRLRRGTISTVTALKRTRRLGEWKSRSVKRKTRVNLFDRAARLELA